MGHICLLRLMSNEADDSFCLTIKAPDKSYVVAIIELQCMKILLMLSVKINQSFRLFDLLEYDVINIRVLNLISWQK